MESDNPVSVGISSAVNNRGMGTRSRQSPIYMWGFARRTQHHCVASVRYVPCLLAARPCDQLLDLGQDFRDNDIDACGGRMQPIGLVEFCVGCNAVEEERIEQRPVFLGELGIH